MSDRAIITIRDEKDELCIFLQIHGNPEVIMPAIERAMSYSLPCHRFNAGDFCAALVRVLKNAPGEVYVVSKPELIEDIDYWYTITGFQGSLKIEQKSFPVSGSQ